MAANKTYKPEVHWDQTAFEGLRATWSPERIDEDEKTLKEIFALAADVPLLAEALDWAEQHNVKFFIDRTAVNARGYTMSGTGVFGITEKIAQDPVDAVSTLVHEIRHIWHDYNGLGKELTHGFSWYFITTALREADAKAVGLRAGDQARAAQLKKQNLPVPEALQDSLADENADLGKKFLVRFSMPRWTTYYGDMASKYGIVNLR